MDNYTVLTKSKKTKTCTYYSAVNKETNKQVTIQKLHEKRLTWQELLCRREVAAMKQPGNSCLPKLIEIIKDDGQFFFILQKMENNLEQLRNNKLTVQQSIEFAIKLLEAVQKMHQMGLTTYLLRPQCFFFEGGKFIVGHLQTQKDSSKYDLTESQDLKYSAPENVMNAKTVDCASNVFSLGCIISELILGQHLLGAKTKMQYLYSITELFPKEAKDVPTDRPINMKDSNSFDRRMSAKCSPELQATLNQMLSINPGSRLTILQALQRLMKLDKTKQGVVEKREQSAKRQRVESVQQKKKTEIKESLVKIEKAEKEKIHEKTEKIEKVNKLPELKPKDVKEAKQVDFRDEDEMPVDKLLDMLKLTKPLKSEQNVEDDVTQTIIIRKSEAPDLPQLQSSQPSANRRRSGRPQLTNFAMNDGNLGVQLGSSFFSDTDNIPF